MYRYVKPYTKNLCFMITYRIVIVIICTINNYTQLHDCYIFKSNLSFLSTSYKCDHNCKHHSMTFYNHGHVEHMTTMTRHMNINMTHGST